MAVTALLVALAAPVWAEGAGSVTEVGWWTSSPVAMAPEGGVAVQAAPDGSAISVAAVRVALTSPDLRSASLALKEAGGAGATNAVLHVCRATGSWKAAAGGPMAEAPKPECERGAVRLERNDATAVWSANVLPLLRASSEPTTTLMVRPAGAGTVPIGWEVRFERPELHAEAAPAFDGGGASTDAPPDDGAGSSGTDGSTSSPFDGGAGLPDGLGTGPVDAPPAPVAPSADGAPGADAGSDTVAVGLPARVGTTSGPTGMPWMQGFFFVVVAGAVGVAAGLAHRRQRLTADAF
ncbi:MAG TPA: hypothetical protein VM030_00135 [Acidimicrobiales bacterium]|nr:hypothetical protein [Acidimicrobiales bacterium]